ncbi:MAG: DUF4255 domain-containing protein [Bryobacterales bacterium]|nr:DUF4255 domain-containing protein [Bryobacterales bacterium]
MADFSALAATGNSIVRLLNASFQEQEPVEDKKTKALLVRTEDFTNPGASIPAPALSIFFYRVDFNRTMRASWSAVGSQDGLAHLPVDLHFLITPWAENADHQLRILGKSMQCLESTPVLSGALLDASAGWAPSEAVQLMLGEISTEEVMRTFDSLPTEYRLSVPYLARVVRIDGRRARPTAPVTTLVAGATPTVPL